MSDKVKIIGISGSLRKDSFSTAILRTIAAHTGSDIDLVVTSIAEIPLYNQDNDGDASPASVVNLRKSVAEAHALLLVTPEYNYGVPGVLKNTVDWLSRPGYKSCLVGKHFSIISSSMAFTGGVRAQAQLRESMVAALAIPVVMPEVVIASAQNKVSEGKLTDQATIDFAVKAVKTLAEGYLKSKK